MSIKLLSNDLTIDTNQTLANMDMVIIHLHHDISNGIEGEVFTDFMYGNQASFAEITALVALVPVEIKSSIINTFLFFKLHPSILFFVPCFLLPSRMYDIGNFNLCEIYAAHAIPAVATPATTSKFLVFISFKNGFPRSINLYKEKRGGPFYTLFCTVDFIGY